MTTRSTTPAANRSGIEKSTSPESSTLDRRRDKMQATQSAAKTTTAAVTTLDNRLTAITRHRRAQDAELAAALDRVAALKKAIKTSTKDRDKVRSARKDARRDAAKATQRAQHAEARYDHAVLADMLDREKNIDLSAHSNTHPDGHSGHNSGPAASDRLVQALAPHPSGATQSPTTTRPRSRTTESR